MDTPPNSPTAVMKRQHWAMSAPRRNFQRRRTWTNSVDDALRDALLRGELEPTRECASGVMEAALRYLYPDHLHYAHCLCVHMQQYVVDGSVQDIVSWLHAAVPRQVAAVQAELPHDDSALCVCGKREAEHTCLLFRVSEDNEWDEELGMWVVA